MNQAKHLCVVVAALAITVLAAQQVQAGPYYDAVMADSPIGYWQFEESSGAAVDSSGNLRDGTYMLGVTPGVAAGAGTIGGFSAEFDGTTGYIDLPGTWGGVGMTELTLEALINTADPTTGTFQTILAGHDPNSFAHFSVYSGGNSGVYADPGPAFVPTPITPDTPTGEWRHVVLTSKSGETMVYINGTQFGAVNTTAYDNISESSTVDIGLGHVSTRWFKGLMDEVAIYDTALPAARVQAHFDATGISVEPPPPAELIAHWKFDTDASDVTGNHDGALGGGAAITSEAQAGVGALDLRDIAGYVDIPTTVLGGEESCSVSFFVSLDSLDHACCHAVFANDGWLPGNLHLNLMTATGLGQLALSGTGASTWGATTTAVPTDGSWTHVAFTYDAASAITTAYFNGAEDGVVANVGALMGNGLGTIGAWNMDTAGGENFDRFLDGRLDDMRIYRGVLTPEQVSELANIPEPSSTVLLVMGLLALVGCAYARRRNRIRHSA